MNIQLSDDNDIIPKDGNLPLVEGLDELAQLAKQNLLSVQGDWFLNLDAGLPMYETILRKSTSITEVEQIYFDAIGQLPGVISVDSFNLEFDGSTRNLNVTFRATTSDGILNFNLREA